jgi:23S rRNA (guanosine2251-2'-O)-methyltransferase
VTKRPGPSDVAAVYGRNPVLEALRAAARSVDEVAILSEGRGPALQELLTLARSRGVKVSYRTRDQLTAIAGTPHHQGVVARVAEATYASLGDLLAVPGERQEPAFLLVLDRVQDPRNLGAVLRSAEASGVHGIVLPKHQAAGLTPVAAKTAMGAVEHIAVARETNIVQVLEIFKKESIWVMGATARGGQDPWSVDLTLPLCLVLGGEGEGLRPLVTRTCDLLLTLPMRGKIGSLNVSAAAAALCYEVVRQRAVRQKPLDLSIPRK